MIDPFSSTAQLQRFVEAELQRAGLHDRPDISIAFQDPERLFHAPPLHPLWWTIASSRLDRSDLLICRHYLLEARYDERQFVIWFGRVIGFRGPAERELMHPAVHLFFPYRPIHAAPRTIRTKLTAMIHGWGGRPDLKGAVTSQAGQPGALPREYPLGAVIRWMLTHEESAAAQWDPMVYPLSGSRY